MKSSRLIIYDFSEFFWISSFSVLFTCPIIDDYKIIYMIIFEFLLVYLLSCLFIKKVIFYESNFTVIYPFRLFCRKYRIDFVDIRRVKMEYSYKYPRKWVVYYSKSKRIWFTTPIAVIKNKTKLVFEILKAQGVKVKSNDKEYCTTDCNDN